MTLGPSFSDQIMAIKRPVVNTRVSHIVHAEPHCMAHIGVSVPSG